MAMKSPCPSWRALQRVLLIAGLSLAASALADEPRRPEQLPDRYVPGAPADDTLYRELGGHDGLSKLVAEFRRRLLADERLAAFFRDVDEERFQQRLVTQFCEVSGGPCRQDAHNMRRVHSGVDINRASFNATVEVLQQAMDAQGVAFSVQNRLLAQLAPMHRDIVNVP
jgi:hemoglobin